VTAETRLRTGIARRWPLPPSDVEAVLDALTAERSRAEAAEAAHAAACEREAALRAALDEARVRDGLRDEAVERDAINVCAARVREAMVMPSGDFGDVLREVARLRAIVEAAAKYRDATEEWFDAREKGSPTMMQAGGQARALWALDALLPPTVPA
jgi:hypothetical protein